jgi:hypothetical protein
MWAMLAVYLNKFDDSVKLNTRKELIEKANIMFEYCNKMSKENGKYAPHAYDWHRKFLFEGKDYKQVLKEALAKASRNIA